ncbi:hypothetical protein [Lysobacter sp. Root983]|uniref:hypothetical protein n=1 Tax=Lysobacter sp. Root983 TaxID=1736613 RepID=UPI0012F7BD3F|nr:hypothetical protein [Lysobacter sp. Root983]
MNQIDPETGLILLEEISWQDLTERGFSVQRKTLYSEAEAIQFAEERKEFRAQKGKVSEYILTGALIACVRAVHEIKADEDGSQTFRVLQTPREGQPGHAEIRIADHIAQVRVSKDRMLKYRLELCNALGPLRPSSDIDSE